MSLLLARPRFKRRGYTVDGTVPRAVAFAVLREIRLEQLRWRAIRDSLGGRLEAPERVRSRDRLSYKLSAISLVASNVRYAIDMELG